MKQLHIDFIAFCLEVDVFLNLICRPHAAMRKTSSQDPATMTKQSDYRQLGKVKSNHSMMIIGPKIFHLRYPTLVLVCIRMSCTQIQTSFPVSGVWVLSLIAYFGVGTITEAAGDSGSYVIAVDHSQRHQFDCVCFCLASTNHLQAHMHFNGTYNWYLLFFCCTYLRREFCRLSHFGKAWNCCLLTFVPLRKVPHLLHGFSVVFLILVRVRSRRQQDQNGQLSYQFT